jgi:Flp pilus assembly protein TadD
VNRADVRRRQGDLDGAIADAAADLALEPGRAEAELIRAKALLDRGGADDLVAAEAAFARFLAARPREAVTWLDLAACRENRQDFAGAREAYRRALELLPEGDQAAFARDRLEKVEAALRRGGS